MANMIASSFNLPFPLPYAKSLIHPSFLPPLLSSPFFNGNPKHIIRLTIRTHIALFSLSITTPLHLVMYIHTYIRTTFMIYRLQHRKSTYCMRARSVSKIVSICQCRRYSAINSLDYLQCSPVPFRSD